MIKHKNRKRLFYYIPLSIFLLFLLLQGNCVCTENVTAPERNNPNDPAAPNYVPPPAPVVDIRTGLTDGSTLTVDFVTFSFAGNNSVAEYAYRLQGQTGSWSAWGTDTSVTYNYLDEGSYIFFAKGRSDLGEESYDSVRFTVNAVVGPALMMYPKYVTAGLHETLTVNIMAEEVTNVMQADLVVNFNTTYLEAVAIQPGAFLGTNGGEVQFFSRTSDSTITIHTGVALANPAGVNGTGVLAALRFRTKAQGNGQIRINDASKLLTPNGIYNEINLTNKRFNAAFRIN